MSTKLSSKGLKPQAQETGRDPGLSVNDVAYRPATVEELQANRKERKAELQSIYEGYKEAKKALREAVLKYRRTGKEEDKATVLKLTDDLATDYFSQDNPFNSVHVVLYNPRPLNDVQSVPTYGYLYRDLLFEHHRTTKIPEDVGILTYPRANPAEFFFKPKVETSAQPSPAPLGAAVGSGQKGGAADEPKKKLSSRQIGAIIAARKAGRF
jgi:hypothetical protein